MSLASHATRRLTDLYRQVLTHVRQENAEAIAYHSPMAVGLQTRMEPLEPRLLLSGNALADLGVGPSTLGAPEDLASGRMTVMIQDSGPVAPAGEAGTIVSMLPQSAVMLSQVPTSTWTYGCSATAAGMIFGYYDRTGYPNMYTGPANGGVAPLTDLGQGDIPSSPIAGACSIIATQLGFDGRSTLGHVDDYWISYGSSGPDPWEGHWTEHTWGSCTADYMGTNQWKWDYDLNGTKDTNTDGSTSLWTYSSGAPLYDCIPDASHGLPPTELCHGMRLFAESRGYTVLTNYTQKIDTVASGGFSFANYEAEINAGDPVMIQVTGHSMVGVGYDAATQTVYLHDTWDNNTHSMTWGGSYSGMAEQAVTVIHLAPIQQPQVSVSVSPSSVAEDGAANLVYTFTRSVSSGSALTVSFSVGGAATYNTDYTQSGAGSFSATAGTVTIPANQTMATVTIDPTADSTVEPDEAVVLTVTSGTGYNVGSPSSASGTILNDDIGGISQWAASVIGFSSQYSSGSWSAAQAVGAPNVGGYGDNPLAWAPLPANGTTEWIALGYATPVYATGVTIRETYGNGFVTKVEYRNATTQAWQTAWTGTDPTAAVVPADFSPAVTAAGYLVDGVRITVDTNHSSSWEEIDAVQLLTGTVSIPDANL